MREQKREEIKAQQIQDAEKMEIMMKEFAKKFNKKGSIRNLNIERKKNEKGNRAKGPRHQNNKEKHKREDQDVEISGKASPKGNSKLTSKQVSMNSSSKNIRKIELLRSPNRRNKRHREEAKNDYLRNAQSKHADSKDRESVGKYQSVKLGLQTFKEKDFSMFNQVRSRRKIPGLKTSIQVPGKSQRDDSLQRKVNEIAHISSTKMGEGEAKETITLYHNNKSKERKGHIRDKETIPEKSEISNETENTEKMENIETKEVKMTEPEVHPEKPKKTYIEILKSYNSQKKRPPKENAIISKKDEKPGDPKRRVSER